MFSQIPHRENDDRRQDNLPGRVDDRLFWRALRDLGIGAGAFGVVVFGVIQLAELASLPEGAAPEDLVFQRLLYILASVVALCISAAAVYAGQGELRAYYYEVSHRGFMARADMLERQVSMHQKARDAGFVICQRGEIVPEDEMGERPPGFDYDLALERLLAFVRKAWVASERAGEKPNERAVGFDRDNFCPSANSGSFARQLYDAALGWVRNERVGLLVGRNAPLSGWFGVDSLEDALELVKEKFEYVKLPAVLGQVEKTDGPNSPPKSPKSPKYIEGRHKDNRGRGNNGE